MSTAKSHLMHPAVLFSVVWMTVIGLYLLRLSKVLIAGNEEITRAAGLIIFPYIIVSGIVVLFLWLVPKRLVLRRHLLCAGDAPSEVQTLKRRLRKWFIFWMIASAAEILYSGGLPLIWLFTGSSKTYFDFGIPSVHGLLNSILLAIGVSYAGIYAKHGDWRNLLWPAGIIFWALLLVTRSMIVIDILQTVIAILLYRGISAKLFIKLVAILLIVVLGFGMLGDVRTGADNFRTLAQPTQSYPDWLPSGLLWIYIYLTTPINNLIYTMSFVHPVNNILFPNTAAPLFPSLIRNVIYGNSLDTALSGELANSAFNVSTAFIGPFQDYGTWGIIVFNALISLVAVFYWARTNFRDRLIYVVIAQCLLMTVFFNHFFSLPVITQVFWLYIFFWKRRARMQTVMPMIQVPG